jgi:hypothetical protein
MFKIRPVMDIPHPIPEGETHTCFISMVKRDDGDYDSAYRNFSPANDVESCSIRYQRYTHDLKLAGSSKLLHKGGQDPRSFRFNGRSYACVLDGHTSRSTQADYFQTIIDLETGIVKRLNATGLSFQGKNWVPAPDDKNGCLYFVRSIDPPCVLKSDPDWNCTIVIAPSHPIYIGQYRGGSAAEVSKEIIQGFGHRTINRDRHVPYGYRINLTTGQTWVENITPADFGENLILDPTSVIEHGILMACSDKPWDARDLKISTKLCEIYG